MKKILFALACLPFLLSSCHEPSNVNGQVVREEIENRKIKRITAAMIMEYTQNRGKRIVNSLDSTVMAGLSSGKPISCEPFFMAYAAELAQRHEGFAMRFAIKSGKLPANEKEKGIIEAYRYSAGTINNVPDNLQPIADTSILYNASIIAQKACLPCHGEKPSTPALNKLQPNDTLTGFPEGKAIGLYSINLRKEYIIKHIQVKY